MKTILSILCDNTCFKPGFIAEHGFSVFIERGEKKILFDTGSGVGLFHNASLAGIDLSKIDCLILSHGHSDHTGGLSKLLSINPELKIYAHPQIIVPKFKILNGKSKYIGINKRIINKYSDNFIFVKKPLEIFEGIWLSGEIKRIFPQKASDRYYTDNNLEHPDMCTDEQFLIIDHGSEVSVLTGCCHFGIRNIFPLIKKIFNTTAIKCLIGGLHLRHIEESEMNSCMESLITTNPKMIGAAHCTGLDAYAAIKFSFPSSSFWASTGMKIEI